MNYIYFGTIDGSLVTNYELSTMSKIVNGKQIPADDLEAIREYAKTCKGVKKEIRNPSVKFLLKHGEKYKAIFLYYKMHPQLSVTDAKKIIDEMEKKMQQNIVK